MTSVGCIKEEVHVKWLDIMMPTMLVTMTHNDQLQIICSILDQGLISWSSKENMTLSLSIIEMEYKAVVTTSQESMWPMHLMKNLH